MERKLNLNTLLFFIAFGVMTLISLIFVWINIGQPFKIDSLGEMKEANYSDYLEKKGVDFEDNNSSSYYVYIYSDKYESNNWYKELVIEYANYARTHSSARPIYAYNYDGEGNSKIKDSLGSSVTLGKDIPGLILVKDKSVSIKYFSYSKLSNELTDAMNK